MLKTLVLLSLYASLSYAHEEDKNVISDHWFRILPEAQSLLSFGVPKARALRPTSIKTLVWNIRKAELLDWPTEFKKYGENRDLFLLQEALRTNIFNSTLSHFQTNKWNMGISFIYRKTDTATGSMIGSSVEPTELYVKHSTNDEPFADTPKALTIAKYPIEGKAQELLVISVHAINFQTTGAFKRHIEMGAEMVRAHEGPVLFAGDFNSWNGPRTDYLFGLMKRLGLEAVTLKNADARMKFAGYPLDHAFSRGVKILNAEVISDSKGSDHKPILMEMSVL